MYITVGILHPVPISVSSSLLRLSGIDLKCPQIRMIDYLLIKFMDMP